MTIDTKVEESEDAPEQNWQDTLANHKVLQLKGNVIPKGLVPLEKLFDKNNVLVNPSKRVEEVNIGIEEESRVVKLSKKVLEAYKEQYI